MSVAIAGTLIRSSNQLSDVARQALVCINGGPQWLDWAMSSPAMYCEAADESGLIAQIQQRLHASPMTLLPGLGLWVSPVKLMSLGSADLRTLGKAEAGDTSVAVLEQTRRIFADQALLGEKDLRCSGEFLQALGVAAAPLFQACGFDDLLAVHAMMDAGLDSDGDDKERLHQEAAAFAVEKARTVPEFCDYYRIYLAYTKKMDALDSTAVARKAMVDGAVQTLLPLTLGATDCPRLPDRLPSPYAVRESLRDWHGDGRALGFSRLSLVVLQVVSQTAFRTETGDAAYELCDRYLASAQAFLTRNTGIEGRIGQDGSSLTFTVRDGRQQAVLLVDPDRMLSLAFFGAREQPAATA